MKSFTIPILFLALPFFAGAQTILLEENVAEAYDVSDYGKNLKHYHHFYIGFGFVISQPEGQAADIKYPDSGDFMLGFRYKRKLSDIFAAGIDIGFWNQQYKLRQKNSKTFPNSLLHEKEKMKFNNLGLEGYLRINFGRRGNSIGNFLDFGGYGNWAFSIKHSHKDKSEIAEGGAGAEQMRVVQKKLNYVEHFSYGVRVRLGLNRYVFYATYRFADLINQKFDYELPRVSAGFQISLH